jgi:hypothetical protein
MKSMLMDLAAVYLRIILPYDLSFRFPSVSQNWQNFWGKPGTGASLFDDPKEIFHSFLRSIMPGGSHLYFLHLDLPHLPWKYLPSGKKYDFFRFGYMGVEGLDRFEVWGKDDEIVLKGYQRHLLQVAFVDRLIGELIDRLKKTGLYDEALVIVTADHGVSFRAGTSRRGLDPAHPTDIMGVPLFFRSPNQSMGFVSDRPVELVDIFPSLARVLGTPIPWKVDGRSFLESDFPQREERVFFYSGKLIHQKYDPEARSAELQKKIKYFGERTPNEQLFQIGPHAQWIGKPVTEAGFPVQSGIRILLDHPESYVDVDLDAPLVPSYITGRVVGKNEELHGTLLAVAVNGILRAVTGTHPLPDGTIVFSCLVPEDSFHQGSNKVEVLALRAM